MVQRLWNYSIRKNWVLGGIPCKGLMGCCPCHCTYLGQDDSIELQMRINLGVVGLQRYQNLGARDDNTKNGLTGQWPCRCPYSGQDSSINLEMARIGSVVVVALQQSQECGYPMENFARVQQAKAYAFAYLRTMSSHKTWDGPNRSSGWRITTSARLLVPNGNFQKGPVGQWPCRCTSTYYDGSINLEMVQSGPVDL